MSETRAGTSSELDPIHVRIRDLRKSYQGNEILRGVSVDFLRGKTNVILGASGSGKTTFMRQLVRLEKPDSGQILLDGQDIAQLTEVQLQPFRPRFGMVFQMAAIFDSMNVYDNVAFMLREHTKLSEKQVRERVLDRLTALGIAHAEKRMSSELSGGMRKRVALARALVMEPEILIYDEPTTGLDPITSRTVDDLIDETREKFGVTSVVISHDMASVFRIGHVIAYLYKGQIVANGTPKEFLQHADEHLLEFLEASGLTRTALEELARRETS